MVVLESNAGRRSDTREDPDDHPAQPSRYRAREPRQRRAVRRQHRLSRLVNRFDRRLRSVARSYRLAPQDVDDAVQETWVKLYEHIDGIRDRAAIAGWLTTTVRRQSLRVLQMHVREHLTDDPELLCGSQDDGPEPQLLESERRLALTRGRLAAGPPAAPDDAARVRRGANYEQIGAKLDMPVGSIGPIRARSLARLQRHPELTEFAAAA